MKIVLAVLGGVIVVAAGLLAWLGAFAPVQVQEQEMGPYPFVYVQDPTTEFSRVGELTEALGERLEAAGFSERKPAQIYYPQGRGIQNQFGFVVDRAVPLDVLGSDTFFRPVPATLCAVARFPFRNPLSFIVGHYRVEPALREYRLAKKYEDRYAMVILEGDAIVYLQPVSPAG